jgi:hypothetical protein
MRERSVGSGYEGCSARISARSCCRIAILVVPLMASFLLDSLVLNGCVGARALGGGMAGGRATMANMWAANEGLSGCAAPPATPPHGFPGGPRWGDSDCCPAC